MIKQLHVQNYKALRDVRIDLTSMHVLIGPNNSGKTSILEALNALCRSVDYPLDLAFPGQWKGHELVTRASRSDPVYFSSALCDDRSEFNYTLGVRFHAEPSRHSVVDQEFVLDGSTRVNFGVGNPAETQVKAIAERGSGNQSQQAAARRIHDALSGVQYYRWDARQLALPAAPDSSRRFRMDPSGFGLALCLHDILGYDRETFARLEMRFRQIFPEIRSIKLIPEPAYKAAVDVSRPVPMLQQSDGKGIYFQFSGSEALVPASQASDGVLLVLAYLTILSVPTPPRVILVEEPENGIHPKRLTDVLSILRDLLKERTKTQVLLTTHSPYVLDLFSPEEVTLCRREEGETKVARLSESEKVREQLELFTLGEIWTSEGDEKIAAGTGATGGTQS